MCEVRVGQARVSGVRVGVVRVGQGSTCRKGWEGAGAVSPPDTEPR